MGIDALVLNAYVQHTVFSLKFGMVLARHARQALGAARSLYGAKPYAGLWPLTGGRIPGGARLGGIPAIWDQAALQGHNIFDVTTGAAPRPRPAATWPGAAPEGLNRD